MDAIRIPKVAQVACTRNGSTLVGTIHLTAHHLIFRYDDDKEKELWVPYPLISLVTRLPQTHQGKTPLTFNTRTFETFSLAFGRDSDAADVFDSVKDLTVATSVQQLYAFSYAPNPPLPTNDGWNLYSPREEFGRMGVGTRTKAWRFTDINKDYSFSPTYPARLVVPTRISDATLQYASKYRSKARVPALTYLHWANYGSITRSSQPMVGITQNRSIQDEKLIESIFQTHNSPESRASAGPVYGATTTNLIIDARPTINAVSNTAKGAGTENMDHYKDGKKAYLNIDNIHVMRESLAKVVDALREAELLLASINNDLPEQVTGISVLDRQALRRSGWLRHIQTILEGTVLITRNVHINSSHVLIHCSDGWDRTSQLAALAQLCLDPFYRTIRGFEILVEKDWVSFGYKFMDRCGHLSSDKFFVSPQELGGGGNSGAEAAQAFLASMQNRFASNSHLKETSPVFHQFLETVRQIQRQFPDRFEFNERFLHQLYYHLFSCQFGTFLFNTERERRVSGEDGSAPCERTKSIWDLFNSPAEMELNTNPTYNPQLDDPTSRAPKADMGVLIPNPKDVRFWHELYGRGDDEMNGRPQPAQIAETDVASPDDESPTPSVLPPPSPSPTPAIATPSSSQLTPGPATPRSPSPAPATVVPRPIPSRVDSFRPVSGGGSAFSLQGVTTPSPPPPASPATPRTASIQPNFFANTGKSVWGKLSSNATAAFSAVQEAYASASKELNATRETRDDPMQPKTAELSNRSVLKAWGEENTTSSSLSASHNPWGSSSTSSVMSASTSSTNSVWDNPWGSSSSEMSTPTARADPMALVGGGLEGMTLESVGAPSPPRKEVASAVPDRPASPKIGPPSTNIDPLGVGFS
ncbi:Protein phosphatase [Mycena chlorophos]|uniref:Protein phosphatase n=1 Tax=Mycena chlorophos TaxID=658473 RepID=A0A8H6TTS4_MYCCL|nr:Protein phosphatase [Mycena chlorophos]